MSDILKQVRTIASRGRMDDADVQIVFDAADEIERERALADDLADKLGILRDAYLHLLDHPDSPRHLPIIDADAVLARYRAQRGGNDE